MIVRIIGVDPGPNCGIAIWPEQVSTTVDSFNGVLRTLDRFFKKDTILVIERYISRFKTKYGDETLRLIGGIEALSLLRGIEVKFKDPFVKKFYQDFTDWDPKTKHEKDAVSMVLAYNDTDRMART